MKTTSWEQIKIILHGIGASLKNSIRELHVEIEKAITEAKRANSKAEQAATQANDAKTTANSALNSVDGKLDKRNPVVDGHFSLGRKEGTAANGWSFVAGRDCAAGGVGSQAFGFETIASGDYSCAEGYWTFAKGPHSHAEGYGSETELGASHAEGQNSRALALASHAEGIDTIAKSKAQHVQGQKNIEDAENRYAHIVGNGTASVRSNAHTLDWYGNGWYAGDLYVGGTSQDDASKVLTNADMDSIADAVIAKIPSAEGVGF